MASSIEQRNRITKRSSNSYSSEEWKQHRPLITKLYFEEGRTLKEVRMILENEYNFVPTERMYKSRLHSWGLDKKKKEHEMLDIVRMGLQQKEGDKDPVFQIRGRQVTLADALHYFNRKGIKDPQSLLEQPSDGSVESSTPSDLDITTPIHAQADWPLSLNPDEDNTLEEYQQGDRKRRSAPITPVVNLSLALAKSETDFAEKRLEALQRQLGITHLGPMTPFGMLPVESAIPQTVPSALEHNFMEAILFQTRTHYSAIFASRNLSVDNTIWTATSDDALADQFYYGMYHGYSYLYDGQRDKAFEIFNQAFELIQSLLKDRHVGFLIYIYDMIIRYEGLEKEEPLLYLLDFLADMAYTVFQSNNHPIRLIALWLKQATNMRSSLAEFTLRRMLDFFQDSIGYFHPETMALLQMFASGLMNRHRYLEASMRFHQLVEAFETTHGRGSYDVCYALRCTSEAYFYQQRYPEALQALKEALKCSETLPRMEEREIYVRCLRGMAEISKKLGRDDEANATMHHVVETCKEAFGPDHTFTQRAEMHEKSLRDGDASGKSAIPPMIYRLGRGGNAAKYVWTSRSSLSLQT